MGLDLLKQTVEGLREDAERYGGSAQSGYVDNTNIPKHLGGVV